MSTYTRALRSLILAPVSVLFIPSVETIGVAATNTIAGVLAVIGYLYVSSLSSKPISEHGLTSAIV